MRKDSKEGVIRTDDRQKGGDAEEYDGYCIDLLKLLQQVDEWRLEHSSYSATFRT